MDNLSVADISQQYRNTLLEYNGRPVKATEVLSKDRVLIWDLSSQSYQEIPFSRATLLPLSSRLGMINIRDTAMYISRIPARRMYVGLAVETLNLSVIHRTASDRRNIEDISSLTCPEIVKMLDGVYPSLQEALGFIRRYESKALAFDKQFAVDREGTVFYKNIAAGAVSRDATSASQIVFKNRYHYLSVLLENNHEKTVRIACTA